MVLNRRTFLKLGLTAALWPTAGMADSAPFKALSTLSDAGRGRLVRRHSVCGMCRAGCLIDVVIEAGRLLRVEGNAADLTTGGRLCARGLAAPALVYDPDLLRYPLRRVGERGEGRWRRISWGEAIDTISGKINQELRAGGAERLALLAGGSSASFIKELFTDFGCRQINDAAWEYCRANQDLASDLSFGRGGGLDMSFEQASCLIFLGSHLGENVEVPVMRKFSQALARGADLIVADPRFSSVAAKARYHLMLRPGSDNALLLAWLKYIIENGLYNRELESSFDLEGLRVRLASYDFEELSAACDLKTADIRASAELMSSAAPAVFVYPGRHNSWYGNDVQRLRLKAVLNVVLGAESKVVNDVRPPRVPEADRLYSTIINRIQQGRIGCLGIWGQNPLQAHPNTYRTINALRKADFIFCCDIYPGEAALYADIILPEAGFLERSEIVVSPGRRRAALRQAVMPPRFEAREPYWIVKQISSRLGRGRRFGFDSVKGRLTDDLRQMGLSWDKLQERGFAAPLIAAAPLAASAASAVRIRLKNELPHGTVEQLLEFTAVPHPPKGFARLLSGRSPVDSRGLVNNRWLRHELEENELWLNDRLARRLGIVQGQELFLENQDGLRSMRPARIKVTPGIRVDCLYMAHGFGCQSPFLTAAYGRGVADSPLMVRSIPDLLSGVRGGRVNFVRFIKDGAPLPIPSLDLPLTASGPYGEV